MRDARVGAVAGRSPVTRAGVWAHRGARRRAPENTLAAFAAARDLGADGVELDVHRTVDGALIVHHDARHPALGLLADRTLEEVRAAAPEVPTLEASLDACAGLVVDVELKHLPGEPDHDSWPALVAAAAALLGGRAARGRDRVLVSSFDLDALDRFRAAEPGIATHLLLLVGFDLAEGASLAASRGHAGVNPDVRGLADRASAAASIAAAHARGLRVVPWTVNEPEHISMLVGAGADALVTDVPDVALRTLGREAGRRG